MTDAARPPTLPYGRSVTVFGAGNIGSHLIPHLARIPQIARVTIVDRDVYDETNLAGQEMFPRDVGREKARVQAARLRKIRPGIGARPLVGDLADLPPALFRADLLLACLDSRAARQDVNELAWIMGVPWIDSGVNAGAMLAQVRAYFPGAQSPCLECAWSDRDYDLIEQAYPCGVPPEAPSTSAPSALGSLAASLLAIEAMKVLSGSLDSTAPARSVLYDTTHHQLHTPLYRFNPECRFHHRVGPHIETYDQPAHFASLDDIATFCSSGETIDPSTEIEFIGRRFLIGLRCNRCGTHRPTLRLVGRGEVAVRSCARCGGEAHASSIDRRSRIAPAALPPAVRARTLRRIGARNGDLARVCVGGVEGVERLIRITSGGDDSDTELSEFQPEESVIPQ